MNFKYIEQRKKNVIDAFWCYFDGTQLRGGLSSADGQGFGNLRSE